MFEVQDLKYATLATVSRCGMVWFSDDVVSTEMLFANFLKRLRAISLDDADEQQQPNAAAAADAKFMAPKQRRDDDEPATLSPVMQVQHDCCDVLKPFFSGDGLVVNALDYAKRLNHVMDFTKLRALSPLFSIVTQGVRNILQYNVTHPDFLMKVRKRLLLLDVNI